MCSRDEVSITRVLLLALEGTTADNIEVWTILVQWVLCMVNNASKVDRYGFPYVNPLSGDEVLLCKVERSRC